MNVTSMLDVGAARISELTDQPLNRRALRIAMVTEYYYPHLGGMTEHVHYLSRELRRQGHFVDIVTSRIDGVPEREHVVRVGRSLPVYGNASMARVTIAPQLARQVRDVLRRGAYDLVHVHAPLNPTLPLAAIAAAEVPVVGTFHTYYPRSATYRLFGKWFQRYVDRLDAVVAVSDAAVESHARYFSADWQVVPNGIDVTEFRPGLSAPVECRDGDPVILFVGRFDPRNALGTLLEAFEHVERVHPTARLVVVGDGPLRGYYRRLAGGNPRIHFVGALTRERAAYFANAAVYACPTTRASFGITLLESMATGTPVVCSDIPGFRSVVQHGREALMTRLGDPRALAAALSRVLSDDALRARLGARGRELSMRYSWPRVTRQVLEVYHGIGVRSAAESAA
jgi:phosphatidylinositol alpha-mannosyltransferase